MIGDKENFIKMTKTCLNFNDILMKNSIQTFVAICMALMLLPIEALAQQALGGGLLES